MSDSTSRRDRTPTRTGGGAAGCFHVASIVNASGGSGISGAEHSLALARRGHRVTMLTYADNSLPRLAHANLEVRTVEPPFRGGTPHPDFVMCFAAAIQRLAAESPVDIIHAHYAITHGEAALLGRDATARETRPGNPRGPAVVITCRGTDITRFATSPLTAPSLQYMLSRADGLTFVSEGLRALANRHLELTHQGHVIPNFLPALDPPGTRHPPLFPSSFAGSVVFFHVSNFRDIKNVCWIVRAFAAAAGRSRHLRLFLLGDGPTRNDAQELARALGVERQTAFLGTVPPEDVSQIIVRGDVLLMASDAEGCPRAVLEAMAEARPVIATDSDGLNEMVRDGHTGRLCPRGDVDAYAAAIVELAADAEMRKRFGANGRAEAERRYNCDAVMSAYEHVYEQALARASILR